MAIIVTASGPTVINGEIPIFSLDLAAARAVYQQMCALAEQYADEISEYYLSKEGRSTAYATRPFSVGSWSPEVQARTDVRGRQGPEDIAVHASFQAPAFVAALQAVGLDSFVYVQKHDLWPVDRYNRLNDREQAEFDINAYEMGFHLGGQQVRRLVRLGLWTHDRAIGYAPCYESEA